MLFDAVGTLIYPSPPVPEAYAAAGERCGSVLDVGTVASRFKEALVEHYAPNEPTSDDRERQRWKAIVASVFLEVSPIEELFEDLWNHFGRAQHWRLFDDVGPTMQKLVARGARLGIASNFDSRLHAIVAEHPALAACEHVFVSSEVGYSKPSREFFRAIERRLAARSEDIVLVGDDVVNDVQGATAAGWRAVLLDRNGTSLGENRIRILGEL